MMAFQRNSLADSMRCIRERCRNHFGVTGKCLYLNLMVCCSFAMLLFGYDQGVFGKSILDLELSIDF